MGENIKRREGEYSLRPMVQIGFINIAFLLALTSFTFAVNCFPNAFAISLFNNKITNKSDYR
jgi:hypothetical protein